MQAIYTVTTRKGHKAIASSLQEAAIAVRDAIETDWIGSTEWYAGIGSAKGAPVKDAAGKIVARISYNGRIWTANGQTEMVDGLWRIPAAQ